MSFRTAMSFCSGLMSDGGGMLQGLKTDIRFPNIGITFHGVGNGITLFGIDIMYYGMIIVSGMLLGVLLACYRAKRAGQSADMVIDFALYAILFSVAGARLYYVVFAWDSFRENPLSVFNLRTGGMAIYGGIIGGVLTAVVYAKIKKVNFGKLADICVPSLLLGQVIGRWGNFFNREAFGTYTDGLFAMQLDRRVVSSDYNCSMAVLEKRYAGQSGALEQIIKIRNNTVWVDGAEYIQVHPTFLYESLWNMMLLVLILLFARHKKFDGELLFWYLAGYGIGRLWMEGLRTDQLFLWGSPLAVSQLLSGLLAVGSTALVLAVRMRLRKKKKGTERKK